jgi:hypothetical protein
VRDPLLITGELKTLLAELEAALQTPPPPTEALVRTGADLKAALKDGGTIRLARNAIFQGNFEVTVPGTTLLGATDLTRRVKPTDIVDIRLSPLDRFVPTLQVSASNVTLRGFTVDNPNPDRETLVVGSPTATSVEQNPTNVALDQLAVVAGTNGGHRGIALHGRDLRVTRSHLQNFWETNRESQGIWISNGPGPYLIDDNFIEASGENLLVGGDRIGILNCVPSDLLIRGNTFFKPQVWRVAPKPVVKNILELKNAQRVVIEGNLFDGNWASGQDGSSVLFTVRNQYGDTPWAVVDEVTLRGNTFQNIPEGFAVNILGNDNLFPSRQSKVIVIERNLFKDARNGVRVSRGVVTDLALIRNTFPAITSTWLSFNGSPKSALRVIDNVARSGDYGIFGEAAGLGVIALSTYTASLQWSGNVVEKTAARWIAWPAGTTLLNPGARTTTLDPLTFKYPGDTVGY